MFSSLLHPVGCFLGTSQPHGGEAGVTSTCDWRPDRGCTGLVPSRRLGWTGSCELRFDRDNDLFRGFFSEESAFGLFANDEAVSIIIVRNSLGVEFLVSFLQEDRQGVGIALQRFLDGRLSTIACGLI